MKKFNYLTTALLLFCAVEAVAKPHGNELKLVVGSYTGTGAAGITSYNFNQENGSSELLDSVYASNASYLAFSKDSRYVYAANENGNAQDSLSSFAFNKKDGSFEAIDKISVEGGAPCYVTIADDVAVTANYLGSLTFVELGSKGKLDKGVYVDDFNKASATPTSHLHTAILSPNGKYLVATDLGKDMIYVYPSQQLKTLSKEKITHKSFALSKDTGPRHLVFNKSGDRLYLIGEYSGKVTIFSFEDGELIELGSVVADELKARGSADIHISNDGRFLYATNRVKGDGIAAFEISNNGNTLTKIGYYPTPNHPRNFVITPNDNYLLVACRFGNIIEVYQRDKATGKLTKQENRSIYTKEPVCLKFAK